jgi:hypothetical protein
VGKIFANHTFGKRLTSKIYKKFQKFHSKNLKSQTKQEQKNPP